MCGGCIGQGCRCLVCARRLDGEGNWGQPSPVWSSVEGPAPPGTAAAAGRARPEQGSGRGSQRRDPDTPLLEPRLEAAARHPWGYRSGPGRAALEFLSAKGIENHTVLGSSPSSAV